jgi:hypothetical protein
MKRDESVEFVEAALNGDVGPEDVGQLDRALLCSRLFIELQKSIERGGDDEVTVALARAPCEKHAQARITQSCVIYCRVSTEEQTNGHGLTRQLKCCADFARLKDYSIAAVFSEVASGIDPLPIRALVERMAKKNQLLILCEDHSRWSRKGSSDVPPAWVIMTSESERLFDEEMRAMIGRRKAIAAELMA